MRVTTPTTQVPRSGASGPMRLARRAIIPIVLIIAAAAIAWRLTSGSATTTTTSTATVSSGTLTVSVSGSGTVAAARSVAVPFKQAGTVTAVDVKVGDTVTAGQTLATIDPADLKLALDQAKASLVAAEATLKAAQSGDATPQEIASAQAQLDSAKAQLAQTKTGTATAADIASAQASLASAKAKLDALKNPTQADVDAAQRKLDTATLSLQSTKDSASQAKTNAQLALQNAVNTLTQAQSKYATAKQNWDFVSETGQDPTNPETTDSAGKVTKNKLSDTQRQAYYDTYVQAEASLSSAQNAVTQAQVAYDTARESEVTQIKQAEANVADAQATLNALLHPSQSDLIQAQAAVTQAQASLDKLRQGGTAAAVASAEATVTQAQASLDKLTSPSSDATIASAQANVLQAQANVASAQQNLDEATLTAPYDGVVSAVSVSVGTPVSSGASAVTVVDRSKLHIEVSLSETDAAKVKVGDPVSLTFDALPSLTMTGTVATVAPAATTSQNVVTYPVTIEFDPGAADVKVGMSATAEIQVEKVDGAILVPSRAVTTSGSTKSVTVLQGGTPVTVQVETGSTSNGQVQIVSCTQTGGQCLKAGDTLQVGGTTTKTTTSSTSSRSGISLGGGVGGPPPGP